MRPVTRIAASALRQSIRAPAFTRVARYAPTTMTNTFSVRRFATVDQDSDDAFKPVTKKVTTSEEEFNDLQSQIKEVVENNKVLLFMKGTPDSPQCGFSSRVVQILGHLNIPYEACNVLESPALREGVKIFSDWATFPQLYINGEFVGGCDIVTNMFTTGELHELLGLAKPEDKSSK